MGSRKRWFGLVAQTWLSKEAPTGGWIVRVDFAAFIVGGIVLAVGVAFGDAGAGWIERVGLIIFGAAFAGALLVFFFGAPYERWKQDSPLRDRATMHQSSPNAWLYGCFERIEARADNGAYLSAWIISALVFDIAYVEVESILRYDNQVIGEWRLKEDSSIFAGSFMTFSKEVTLPQQFASYDPSGLTMELRIRGLEAPGVSRRTVRFANLNLHSPLRGEIA